jgi:glycosyltransferase involved in cell wall biosynthesis
MSLRAAYLVERERVDELVSAVQRLERDVEGVTLVCTGPWPPYSFASGVN